MEWRRGMFRLEDLVRKRQGIQGTIAVIGHKATEQEHTWVVTVFRPMSE